MDMFEGEDEEDNGTDVVVRTRALTGHTRTVGENVKGDRSRNSGELHGPKSRQTLRSLPLSRQFHDGLLKNHPGF